MKRKVKTDDVNQKNKYVNTKDNMEKITEILENNEQLSNLELSQRIVNLYDTDNSINKEDIIMLLTFILSYTGDYMLSLKKENKVLHFLCEKQHELLLLTDTNIETEKHYKA